MNSYRLRFEYQIPSLKNFLNLGYLIRCWFLHFKMEDTWSSLLAQRVKNLVLSPLWLRFDPWVGNFCMSWVRPKPPPKIKGRQTKIGDNGTYLTGVLQSFKVIG